MNPSNVEHWIYKRFYLEADVKAGWNGTKERTTYIHTSYLDCLEHDVWVDEDFLLDAERLRKRDPQRWHNEFLGGWIERADGVVYTTLDRRELQREF